MYWSGAAEQLAHQAAISWHSLRLYCNYCVSSIISINIIVLDILVHRHYKFWSDRRIVTVLMDGCIFLSYELQGFYLLLWKKQSLSERVLLSCVCLCAVLQLAPLVYQTCCFGYRFYYHCNALNNHDSCWIFMCVCASSTRVILT